ncbi:uncharacterized protein LOC122840637 isoform X2 [Gambusia affinis]|uniref:uncharacterized protein LOC122840637 isoform X2 n=1 Tax=Gambusia affinis TaxID=33528 RepID=UPI001CDC2981|nr:uncharacterized protein LOC122840637 isoform X2 [Gambusia affinis]
MVAIFESFKPLTLVANDVTVTQMFDQTKHKENGVFRRQCNVGGRGRPGSVEQLKPWLKCRELKERRKKAVLSGSHMITNRTLPWAPTTKKTTGSGWRIVAHTELLGSIVVRRGAGAFLQLSMGKRRGHPGQMMLNIPRIHLMGSGEAHSTLMAFRDVAVNRRSDTFCIIPLYFHLWMRIKTTLRCVFCLFSSAIVCSLK